jgi:hypothetical protein
MRKGFDPVTNPVRAGTEMAFVDGAWVEPMPGDKEVFVAMTDASEENGGIVLIAPVGGEQVVL